MSSSDDPLLAVMRDIARAPAIELSTLAEPLRAGCVIGRFELVREIGRGGFGVVWEAVDSELGRRVALKTLATARLSSGGIDALKREARVVAKLAHPNLVTLHDVIVHDGSPVLVLELLEGETLEARLVRGALAIPALVDVALAIARGLARAHADGVAHLDLKPSNVFCTTQGTTKILDFGLAAIANMPGHRAGTAGYMAPEQWRGTPDARSDLFALGVVLYRGVSRELPFAAGDLRNLDRAPPALDPELAPVELSALVASLLQTDPARRPANADEVVSSLEQIAERLRADRDPTRNPYRYLDAFTEADRRWFCGRSREIAMLGRLVEQKPLVAVVGTSGAGKSSLVHAGLAASVAARGWRVIRLRPGDSLEMLDRPIDGAALVVVDQLEEVFTRIQDASSRRLFLEAVLSRARDDVRVVVSIREDFLTRLSELPALRDAVAGGMMLLGPPDREALVETLRGPARTLGVEIADDVVAAVIGGVEKELAPLPLVQVAASRLWELRDRTHGRIDATALAKLGGVGGVLATHAEEVVRELRGAGELEVARNIFRLLVTAGRTRIARRHADLIAAAAGPSAERVLGVLIAGRLLAVTTRDGVDEVELAHESLITGWTRLATWLDEDSEALRWRDRLRQAATLWKERGRPSELLWKGSTLAEARGALAGTRDDFLDASTLKSVRARRLRRGLLALAAATLIVTTIMAVVSVRESRRAAAASHREALVQRAAAAKDPLIAALILRELPAAQWPESAVPVALEVSQRAIPMARVVLGTIATTVLSSPRGDVVAVGGDKGHLLRWSSTTQLTTEDLGSPITALAENANHSRIAMSLEDGRVMLTSFTADTVNEVARTDPFNTIAWGDGWVVGITDAGKVVQIAVETHTVKTLDGPPANPEVAIAVSRDGKRIAYGSEGNVVVVSGTTTRTFTGHTDVVYAVAFIDRDRIASASADRT
ncbi:MAG TPA: protein kinase, partial [Kofleriaceae bacterium]|nr:protein kinase [Kofleriaceae bacterium]